MDRISTLSLWLDALATNTLQIGPQNQVFQWTDRSSNANVFVPLRDAYRPIWSTNTIRFTPSSFHMISRRMLPASSTCDVFVVVAPDPLNGPRQPFFDTADFTACETDGRINTQVYADGGEYFQPVYTPNATRSCAVYRGELYASTDVNQLPNYLQKYNPETLSFEYVNAPFLLPNIRALANYSNLLVAAGNNRVDFFTGSSIFSTSQLSSTAFCPIVHNKQLYVTSLGFLTTTSNDVNRPQLYRYTDNSNFARVSTMQSVLTATAGVFEYTNNAMSYGGTIYFNNSNNFNSGSITRLQGVTYNSNSLSNGLNFGLAMYNGFPVFGRADIRMWKYNDNTFVTFGRLNYASNNGLAMSAYKNGFYVLKNTTVTSNTIDYTIGETDGESGSSQFNKFTTNNVNLGTFGNMIVHDGSLFFNANSNAFMYKYGNGTTLDSPMVSGQLLLLFRKTPQYVELWMNGQLVQTRPAPFTYNNQSNREMYIGGALGTLNSAYGDPGSDHLQGCFYNYTQYQRNLSTNDRQLAEGLLAWRYGIQDVLPADHPYRNVNPT